MKRTEAFLMLKSYDMSMGRERIEIGVLGSQILMLSINAYYAKLISVFSGVRF